MSQRFGYPIALGLVIGMVFGALMGAARGNAILSMGVGALVAVFMGWFVAVANATDRTERGTGP